MDPKYLKTLLTLWLTQLDEQNEDPYLPPRNRVMLMEGLPRRCGKTQLLVNMSATIVKSGGNIVFVVPTANMRKVAHEMFLKKFKELVVKSSSHTIVHESQGSVTFVAGTENNQDIFAGKQYEGLFMDEQSFYNHRHVWFDALYPAMINALKPKSLIVGLSS